jgi:hypothetical protein
MTELTLAIQSSPVTPPREVKFAIYLQAILFARFLITGVVVYGFLGAAGGHPVTTAVILVLFAAISLSWVFGLWRRLNWLRWFTVVFHVFVIGDVLRGDFERGRGPDLLGCVLIATQITVIVLFLRPVASHWYRRQVA